MINISVLVLTFNEESNISDCLSSVAWSDDIVVLDSGSMDKTIMLAKKKGARIVKRPFDNWAAHQNWAVEKIKFKNPWVFYLDADERMRPELQEELLRIANDPSLKNVAYFCGRKNFFWGKWIKHVYPPSSILRFFRPDYVRFDRLVNPIPIINGSHGYLKNYFYHYNFSKGLEEWFAKHNRYSTLEAHQGISELGKSISAHQLFSADSYERRKALKMLSFRMPFRPIIKFFYLYFVKFGFLDGFPGFTYCILQSIYEYMIVLKMKEFRMESRGLKPLKK
jgi:glycosyltransferase involved in cell wall biosynthesis